jgi:hypothetical protein
MWREYAAVINLINAIKISENADVDIIDEISIISLNKLIEGGAAILAAVNKNHHIVIIGFTHINPLVKNSLRVLVIS